MHIPHAHVDRFIRTSLIPYGWEVMPAEQNIELHSMTWYHRPLKYHSRERCLVSNREHTLLHSMIAIDMYCPPMNIQLTWRMITINIQKLVSGSQGLVVGSFWHMESSDRQEACYQITSLGQLNVSRMIIHLIPFVYWWHGFLPIW